MQTEFSRTFTFRDVIQRTGLQSENHANWGLGQWLQKYFADKGIEPQRILTKKTDPNPRVPAPHCIAHYPMEYFDEVCDELNLDIEEQKRQFTFDFDSDE